MVNRLSDAELRASAHYWDQAMEALQRLISMARTQSEGRRHFDQAIELLTAGYRAEFIAQMRPRPGQPDVSEVNTTLLPPRPAQNGSTPHEGRTPPGSGRIVRAHTVERTTPQAINIANAVREEREGDK